MGEYKVINIMADGTECTDLEHYLDTHELPETTRCILRHMMFPERDTVSMEEQNAAEDSGE